MLDLFSVGRPSDWRNRLIWGDKKYVLPSLLPEFAGQVNLIYIDPPFATGADFSFTVEIEGEMFTKEPSLIEQKAYRDTWGRGLDSYLQWFYETVVLLYELLAEDGSLYVHCDWHVSGHIRLVLEEVFGPEAFDTEIIWKRKDAQSSAETYGIVHDTIFFFRKSQKGTFNKQFIPLSEETADTWYTNEERVEHDTVNRKGQLIRAGSTRRYNKADISAPGLRLGTEAHYEWRGHLPPAARHWAYRKDVMQRLEGEGRLSYSSSGRVYEKRYLDESVGVPAQSIWTDISFLRGMSKRSAESEWVDYPTQKPEALLERIIKASSNEGDLVLDCFCGSGTTAAVAEKLNRRWITCDLGRFAIHTTRKRLLGIPNVKPFVVQNLGKYERQLWQADEFGPNAAQRVARYTRFILDLYHAQPLSGYTWLHGVKGGRVVHVGAVDSPVTLADVRSLIIEWRKSLGKTGAKNSGIDVLGWDFAFELNETARQQAAEAGVDLRFLTIPREVLEKKAVEQGDIQFFELAALFLERHVAGRQITLKLTNFIPPLEYVPQDVRGKITKWDAWIDYWAVDWDFKGDTFHNQWQSYRTRKDKSLHTSVVHQYETPGVYQVQVKVIDILGNDTTKTIEVAVDR
ncbi:MAG: DNA methyltransferase [Anaerolineae bacterium]